VEALNALARGRLEAAGLLGAERLVAHGREWAAGDRLGCRRNDYRPGLEVRNGTRGTVIAPNLRAGSLWVLTDDGRQLNLPPDYLRHVHHGYALTGHASQGATVEHTFLHASPARGGREWAYVAASRHRVDLRVYLTHHDTEAAQEALAARWSRIQAKRLALDQLAPESAAASLSRAGEPQPTARPIPEPVSAAAPRPDQTPGPRPARGPRPGLGL
jgi:ATP-dependent exoDNAse (exonuclease V) alpha subunit